jgi:hypothetical protein
MLYALPIDLLHCAQIGTRLSIVVLPPLHSGISWPDSKLKTEIVLGHQVTPHLALNCWPLYLTQTACLSEFGTRFFLYVDLRFVLAIIL